MYAPTERLGPQLFQEFKRVANAVNRPDIEFLTLQEHNAAPSRVFEGLTVLADGTNWNPGAGQGVYTYYGGAWNRLG